jgi:CheY-like chemotaxis protein
MTGENGMKWRILVVEDDEDMARQILEAIPDFVDPPDTAEGDYCQSFQDAMSRLEVQRYDILILDLKDDSADESTEEEDPAGVKVFEALKRTRFTPVVFYTALAHKVRSEQTSFVRVVEKTQSISKVREEVKAVIATKLPALFRRVEEIQRDYLWDFVGTHWQEFNSPHDQADLAYLLARRLAITLQGEARKLTRKLAGKSIPIADPKNIHLMEMYVRPPVGKNHLAGDILKGTIEGETGYWVILTPSCDFEQAGRLRNILLAGCLPLTEEAEFQSWKQNPNENASLKALIGDNRERVQSERFKFLPGTYFLPDLVMDFQHLKAMPESEVAKLEVIASLDSPYAESVLARFARYFGRLGTPDIDKQIVLNRLQVAQAQNPTQTNTGKDKLSGKE